MKTLFAIAKIINIIALLFLLIGFYGLAIAGFLQVLAATVYFFVFPKSKLIYIYFGLVALFFLIWDLEGFSWLFAIPFFLIVFLSYTIHFNKNKL
jgi:hypothetical protein